MQFSPVLAVHIAGGVVGFLSGAMAITFRKGSRRHALAGDVFVVSMLIMAGCGAGLALMKSQTGNFLGGALTFYLVATAWRTARVRDGRTGVFDWAALLVALGVGAAMVFLGLDKVYGKPGTADGVPAVMNFILGAVVLLAAAGDVRLLLFGGVSGARRLARHLWRMCLALFIAAGSIFLARAHLFPAFMRKSGALFLLTFFPLLLMIFWAIRLRMVEANKRQFHRPGPMPVVAISDGSPAPAGPR